MNAVMTELMEAGESGAFLTGLEKPGSRYWTVFASPDAPTSARSAAARYLARYGRTGALETLVPLLGDEQSSVGRDAQDAVVAVMRRHSNTWSWTRLGTILRRRSTSGLSRSRAVKCVSELGAPEGQKIVVELLSRERATQVSALETLARLTLVPGAELDAAAVAEQTRGLLESPDPQVRRETARVLGRLGDVEAVEKLVELLEDVHEGVRRNAHDALKETTGLQLPPDAERWSIWMSRERTWFESEGSDLLGDLESDDEARIAAAIRSFSGHPLFREEARELIEDRVFGDAVPLRTVACVALGRMVSHASAPILVAALQDRDEGVRNAAYAALRRVTGKDLPNDIDAWEAAVRQR